MYLSELYDQLAESIRVHHASGDLSREVALARLKAQIGASDELAAAILDQPVDPKLFDEYHTWPASDPRSKRYIPEGAQS